MRMRRMRRYEKRCLLERCLSSEERGYYTIGVRVSMFGKMSPVPDVAGRAGMRPGGPCLEHGFTVVFV